MVPRANWLPLVPGFLAILFVPAPVLAATVVKAHFFWSAECPHCRDMVASLDDVIAADPDIVIDRHEVPHDPGGAREFARTVEKLHLPPVVPIVVIGKEVMVGHEPRAEARLRDMIRICLSGPCPDLVGASSGKPAREQVEQPQASPPLAYTRSFNGYSDFHVELSRTITPQCRPQVDTYVDTWIIQSYR